MKKTIHIALAQPKGLCAGVERAIDIVERALTKYSTPLYVRHEIVHNTYVVDYFIKKGVVFIDDLDEVPSHSTVIFSAHGVSQAIWEQAQQKSLFIIDATCPIVTRVHHLIKKRYSQGFLTLMIGHKGHPEVEGTMGQVPNGGVILIESIEDVYALSLEDIKKPLTYITQTTLSIEDTQDIITHLKKRFPHLTEPKKNDICYATHNRQQAIKELSSQVDIMLIVGSKSSSNSSRLKELAVSLNLQTYMIDSPDQLDPLWFNEQQTVGVSAGASVPNILLNKILNKITLFCNVKYINIEGTIESVSFKMVPELENIECSSQLLDQRL